MKTIALSVGKIIYFFLKILGKRGGSLPGKIAIKICPDLIRHFRYPDVTVLVTGTNGKTSTANMISKIFAKSGKKTISNNRGDNIINGITSLLIKSSDLNFKVDAEVLVLEVDELTLAKYLPMIKASDLVVTNFFRDQLDRSGEMETIISKIEATLTNYDKRLFLNQDDPNVKRLDYSSKNAKVKSYGLDLSRDIPKNGEASEGKFCPLCKSPLVYDSHIYSHLGRYHCDRCEFSWQRPDFLATEIDKETMIVNSKRYFYSFDATYHVYNTLCAIAVANTYNIDVDIVNQITSTFSLGIGRMEYMDVAEKKVLLNLVKNPTGANEIIKYIQKNNGQKAILLLLNDNYADGTDISWIWDVNFENLSNVQKVITTGQRAYDMALRFKISQITKEIQVEKNIPYAISALLGCEGCSLYAISTYTGLFGLRDALIYYNKT